MDPADAIAALDRQFAIPGLVRVVAGKGGLACLRIDAPQATGEIYLHGAQITAWKPRGAEEVLFVSSQSRWEDGRAIRGGAPICFPWFGDKSGSPAAPAHGFVRAKAWRLESIAHEGDAVVVSMSTASDASTKKWWPADFRLVLRATFGAELHMELALTNRGAAPLRFEEAIHAYFKLGHIDQAVLHGLDRAEYLDKTDANRRRAQHGPIAIAAETDRIYLDTPAAIEIEDRALGRRIQIAKQNSLTTVIWNPWIDKSRALADFGDDEWTGMVCVEASNVADFAVDLPPGAEHVLRAIVRVAAL